jgi:hypothetical protein
MTLPLRATLIVDPSTSPTAQCGDAKFPGPAPLPHCSSQGSRIVCR